MYNILVYSDNINLINSLDIDLKDINLVIVSTKKINTIFKNIVVNNFLDIFNLDTELFNDKPILIFKNPYLLEYSYLNLLKQIEINNTKIVSMPDPKNSLIKEKLIELINQDDISNNEAIVIYKNLKANNYNTNLKGIFLDYMIGFLNTAEYNNFSKLLNKHIDLHNFSILYTYILNSYYNKFDVVPCSIKMVDERIDYNYAYFYNEIETLVY